VDEAIAGYRKAITLNPKDASAHYNLGIALRARGQLGEAIACFREVIVLAPKDVAARHELAVTLNQSGHGLRQRGKAADALEAHREALAIMQKLSVADPTSIPFQQELAGSYNNIGMALAAMGRPAEALAAQRRALPIRQKLADADPASTGHQGNLAWCRSEIKSQHLAAVQDKLPALLKGDYKPKTNDERLSLAELCTLEKRYRKSTDLYVAAFAADPKLADTLKGGHRYHAACSAALAAGKGEDAARLDDKERTRLRQQALDWLNADLAIYKTLMASGPANVRLLVQQRLKHWQKDSDLAGLRDKAALAELPTAEREQWQRLWAEVAVLADDPLK
jgi:tetratricopeptide (TPR) repeat protein